MAFAAIAGPIAGALVGGMMGGDGEQTQSQSREPWAPIQPWLQELATEGQSARPCEPCKNAGDFGLRHHADLAQR